MAGIAECHASAMPLVGMKMWNRKLHLPIQLQFRFYEFEGPARCLTGDGPMQNIIRNILDMRRKLRSGDGA